MSKWEKRGGCGVAKYAFSANGKYQVSLEEGDEVAIIEFSSGWYRGKVARTGKTGIFPANYVEVTSSSVSTDASASGDAAASAKERKGPMSDAALLVQIKKTLDEWSALSSAMLIEGKSREYFMLRERITSLAEWRRMFQHSKATGGAKDTIRHCIVKLVEWNHKRKEGFMVPHLDGGEIADVEQTTFLELYSLYQGMQRRFEEGAKIPTRAGEMHAADEQIRDVFGSAKLDDDDQSDDKADLGSAKEYQLLLEFSLAMISVGSLRAVLLALLCRDEWVYHGRVFGHPDRKRHARRHHPDGEA